MSLPPLPSFLLPDSPYQHWAYLIIACLLSCLLRPTRRTGGILLVLVVCVMGFTFCVDYIYRSFAPDPVPLTAGKKSNSTFRATASRL